MIAAVAAVPAAAAVVVVVPVAPQTQILMAAVSSGKNKSVAGKRSQIDVVTLPNQMWRRAVDMRATNQNDARSIHEAVPISVISLSSTQMISLAGCNVQSTCPWGPHIQTWWPVHWNYFWKLKVDCIAVSACWRTRPVLPLNCTDTYEHHFTFYLVVIQ